MSSLEEDIAALDKDYFMYEFQLLNMLAHWGWKTCQANKTDECDLSQFKEHKNEKPIL